MIPLVLLALAAPLDSTRQPAARSVARIAADTTHCPNGQPKVRQPNVPACPVWMDVGLVPQRYTPPPAIVAPRETALVRVVTDSGRRP